MGTHKGTDRCGIGNCWALAAACLRQASSIIGVYCDCLLVTVCDCLIYEHRMMPLGMGCGWWQQRQECVSFGTCYDIKVPAVTYRRRQHITVLLILACLHHMHACMWYDACHLMTHETKYLSIVVTPPPCLALIQGGLGACNVTYGEVQAYR